MKCKHEAGWPLRGPRLGIQESIVAFTTVGSGKFPLPPLIPVREVKIILPVTPWLGGLSEVNHEEDEDRAGPNGLHSDPSFPSKTRV